MPDHTAISLDIEAARLAANLRHSPQSRLRATHTENVWTYRAYQGGEPASMIDWKQSAKGREIYIRDHEPIKHKRTFFWTSFTQMGEHKQPIMLLLMSLAHILVDKDRLVGWLSDGLPTTQTTSMIVNLFSHAEQFPAPLVPLKLHNDFVIIAAPLKDTDDALKNAIKIYASQGNRGLLLNLALGANRDEITQTTRNAGWPIVDFAPCQRIDMALCHLLEKTIEATR